MSTVGARTDGTTQTEARTEEAPMTENHRNDTAKRRKKLNSRTREGRERERECFLKI